MDLKSEPNPVFIVDGVCPDTGDLICADETTLPPYMIFMPGVQDYLPVRFDNLNEALLSVQILNQGAEAYSKSQNQNQISGYQVWLYNDEPYGGRMTYEVLSKGVAMYDLFTASLRGDSVRLVRIEPGAVEDPIYVEHQFEECLREIKAVDKKLDADAVSPDGDVYNEVLELLGPVFDEFL